MQRQETERPWSKFPKAWYEELRVLDLRALSTEQLQSLDDLWDSVASRSFLTIPEIAVDPLRGEIDAAFADISGVPSLNDLREILSREPMFRRTANRPDRLGSDQD